ncbi:MAG: FAD-dependent oxidoreductase [Alphaproteobacteria bacterium]|nr:FAD-dependent oxidoreductase [Alphaproteobacteria bacterium]
MPVVCNVIGKIALVTMTNAPVNAIDHEMRAGIIAVLAELAENKTLKHIVLTGSAKIFSAGADASEFNTPPTDPTLPQVVAAIEASPLPVVAAIRGACLGGGLELALACRWRIAHTSAQLGLPEVILGVVPGSGGTQRLPRLVGMETALSMIPSGRSLSAAKALDAGLVDAIADDAVDAACAADLTEALARPAVRAMPAPGAAQAAVADARALAGKKMRGQAAPLAAISLVEMTASTDFDTGLAAERAQFLALRSTPECKALRHVFFAERAARLPDSLKSAAPNSLEKVVVVGGGTMGAGIAYALVQSGSSVTLVERDDDAATAAQSRVSGLFDAAVARGLIQADKAAATLAGMRFQAGYDGLADAGLAIEAAFEDMEVKKSVLTALDAAMPDAVLATNTSYLDVDVMASWLADPTRLVGLHFFSPAHIMKLLEIVRGKASSDTALATGFALAKQLRKLPVMVGVCDGFVGNRMLQRVREAAEHLLLEGAEFTQVDRAMTDFGYAMGLYMTQDLSGLDIAWANRKRQADARDPARLYSRVQDEMCTAGRLGRKTGEGWYIYEKGANPVPNPAVAPLVDAEAARHGITRQPMTDDAVLNRLLLALINEAATLLGEGIATKAADVDLVLVHGYGFPRFRGGPLFHADQIGMAALLEQVKALEAKDPISWKVAPLIEQLAAEERGFLD